MGGSVFLFDFLYRIDFENLGSFSKAEKMKKKLSVIFTGEV